MATVDSFAPQGASEDVPQDPGDDVPAAPVDVGLDPNGPAPTFTDPPANVTLPATADMQANDTSSISCAAGLASGRFVRCAAGQGLAYPADPNTGAYVMDYSGVGYRGGGVPLPTLPTVSTLRPSGGNDAAAIQAALDAAGRRTPDARGWRGRVLLGPGTYKIDRPIVLASSGVALEGTASMGPAATVLTLAGDCKRFIQVTGTGAPGLTGPILNVAKAPVPAGSRTLTLVATTGLNVGDAIRIVSYRNLDWITMIWGGTYPPIRDGKTQSAWGNAKTVSMARRVAKIEGNVVTLDAPLADTLVKDAWSTPTKAYVQKETAPSWLQEFGVSHLKLQGRFIGGTINQTLVVGVSIDGGQNGWLDDIAITDAGWGSVGLRANTRFITVQDVRVLRTGIQDGAALAADFDIYGQRHLVQGCAAEGNRVFYVTYQTSTAAGPNVLQNFRAKGSGLLQPHRLWSPGLLYDNVHMPTGGVQFLNRKTAGSGHGWGTGFSVAYNSLSGVPASGSLPGGFLLQQPPSSSNLGMGNVGRNQSPASDRFDSPNKPIGPPSLWAHQLWLRQGAPALQTVIGPWHVTTADPKGCLAASALQPGAAINIADCDATAQRSLFNITSRGLFKLGESGLCLDGGTGKIGSRLQLAACRDDDLQHFDVPSRGGFATRIRLRQGGTCIQMGASGPQLSDCEAETRPWRFLITHLARP